MASVVLHFAHYNPVRIHKTSRMTPEIERGIGDHLSTIGELLERVSN